MDGSGESTQRRTMISVSGILAAHSCSMLIMDDAIMESSSEPKFVMNNNMPMCNTFTTTTSPNVSSFQATINRCQEDDKSFNFPVKTALLHYVALGFV